MRGLTMFFNLRFGTSLVFGLLNLVYFKFQAQNHYFQQNVDYTITAKLDDKQHAVRAEETILYTNNSDSTLHFIWMHLWPNSYKNEKTALCQQLIEHNNSSLYYSKKEERGFIDSLNFVSNGQILKWEYHSQHLDICKVYLTNPLKPGEKVELSTPFYLKIPSARFSRLGHIAQAYFLTQWYPKPAVFDQEGWHPMPYLDQGEFYSEYGSFDVSIQVPKNYVLAATGDRVDAQEEEEFLKTIEHKTEELIEKEDKEKLSMAFPPSDSVFKTVRFRQNRVHDFAWFADKRYLAVSNQIELPTSGRIVNTWVFFTPKNLGYWKKAIDYVNDAVTFYSKKLGDYPYNHATAVDGTIMAGGGMEYPNITVIGDVQSDMMLDVVITHEVGHNWFYGILGSNERDHPFMDEGLNSFYEMQYVREKYPNKKLSELIGFGSDFPLLGLKNLPYWKDKEFLFYMSMKERKDQPINLSSEEFTSFNYGSIVYSKTPVVFDYLREYVGQEKFDKAMQNYYSQFRFKHPQPKDLFTSLSTSTGIDMSAFELYFVTSTSKFDYKVKHIKRDENGAYEVLIKNKTNHPVPFTTSAYKNNKLISTVWSNGFEGKSRIQFPPIDADVFKIDGENYLPDIQRSNNIIYTKGLFKRRKEINMNLLTALENEEKINLFWLPIAGGNFYNGFMLGAALHNYSLYKKHFEFYLAPLYAFNTKSVAGFAEVAYNFFPKQNFNSISTGLHLKTFAYDYFKPDDYNATYNTSFSPLIL